jgi:hypothetical protein
MKKSNQSEKPRSGFVDRLVRDDAPEGYYATEALEYHADGIAACTGCAFARTGGTCEEDRPCSPHERRDKRSVIFVANDQGHEPLRRSTGEGEV